MICNNKLFPSLNVIKGKILPYDSKGIIRRYNYRSYPNLSPGIVVIIRITWSCHYYKTILSLPWDSKTKESDNQPIYGRVISYK